jgi:hypothetical protein
MNQEIMISDRLGIESGLPRELMLQSPPRAVNASYKIVSLPPTSSSSVSANQTVQFQLPQRGFMRSHSAYLKFQFDTAATGAFSFAGACASAASLLNSIQVQAGPGTVLENLLRYDLFHNNVILAQGGSAEALATECLTSYALPNNLFGATTFAASQSAFTGAAGAQTNLPAGFSGVCSIPLYAGFFCNENSQMIPLELMAGGALVTIQTNSVSRAFNTNVAHISNYTLSNFELIYEEIQPDAAVVAAIRQGLAGGKLIQIAAPSYLNITTQGQTTIRQQFNLSLSSLNAIVWGETTEQDAVTSSKYFKAVNSIANDVNIRREWYLDNTLLFNSPNQLNSDSLVYRELQKALGSTVADHRTSPITQSVGLFNTGNGSYRNQNYLLGLSCKKFIDEGTIFNGSRVNQVTMAITNSADTSSDNQYQVFFLHSYIMLIDAMGNVSKLM